MEVRPGNWRAEPRGPSLGHKKGAPLCEFWVDFLGIGEHFIFAAAQNSARCGVLESPRPSLERVKRSSLVKTKATKDISLAVFEVP